MQSTVRNTNPILLGRGTASLGPGTASLGNYNYKVMHCHIPECRPRQHFCKGLKTHTGKAIHVGHFPFLVITFIIIRY